MRDKRFVAEHRGGPLRNDQHRKLMQWACDCSGNILPLFGKTIDIRLKDALDVAKKWEHGNASVDDARKASVEAIRVANESSSTAAISVARSVGHAVATAHMAEHSLRAAYYALKAVENAGGSVEEERKWQDKQRPSGIKTLVLSARQNMRI